MCQGCKGFAGLLSGLRRWLMPQRLFNCLQSPYGSTAPLLRVRVSLENNGTFSDVLTLKGPPGRELHGARLLSFRPHSDIAYRRVSGFHGLGLLEPHFANQAGGSDQSCAARIDA